MKMSSSNGEEALNVLKSLCLSGGREGLLEQSSIESKDGEGGVIKLKDQEFDMKSTMLELKLKQQDQVTVYSLGSIYLQIRDPDQSLLKYRQECKKVGIDDQVKVLDKAKLVEFFYGRKSADDDDQENDDMEESDKEENDQDKESTQQTQQSSSTKKVVTLGVDKPSSKSSSSHSRDKHHRHHKKDRHHHKQSASSSSSYTKEKKFKGPITNEDLFANLETVVGKRSTDDPTKDSTTATATATTMTSATSEQVSSESKSTAATRTNGSARDDADLLASEQQNLEAQRIKACLSSEGFEVTLLSKDLLKQDRPAVEKITACEIPVGNSASILRPTNHKRDFLRVLELYQQVLKQESNTNHNSSNKSSSKHHDNKRRKSSHPNNNNANTNNSKNHNKRRETLGKPIIVVPNAMTSPITLINAEEFLAQGKYVTRQDMMKRGNKLKRSTSITMKRNIASRLGGGLMEYEIIDNPVTRLAKERDWDRVVAVIAQGAAWQFKGWKYNSPVDIFSKMFGFFIGMEGSPLPRDVTTWNVKKRSPKSRQTWH